MSDSPYKPPHVPRGAGGGHAPIPPVPVAARRAGAIPAAPVALPRRPVEGEAEQEQAERTDPAERWAFSYRGNAGVTLSEGGSEETAFKPAVELPEAHPLTVLFYQDTQTVQTPNVPTAQTFGSYTFDQVTTEPDGGDLDLTRLRLDEANFDQPTAGVIWIANPSAPGASLVKTFLQANAPPFQIEIRYARGGVGGEPCKVRWTINEWEEGQDESVGFLRLEVTPLSSDIDMPMDDLEAITIEVFGFEIPNAAVRARVRVRNGKSESQFDCDWAGGFQVLADRLELSRVRFSPDTALPYSDGAIDISAQVIADAPRPGGSLSLTVSPLAVPSPTGVRFAEYPIHPFARRVNLMLKYGNDPDAPGDAPLGQIFLAFVGKFGRSLCYIDAMSAREALFGAGLPIPAGVSKLVVSNLSTDDTMQIGVLWRLEL